jgi:hypothetical protein
MVKVTGPVFSSDAHGDLGGLLNYHRRPGGSAVARHHQPGSVVKSHAVPSASQVTIRSYYKEAVEHWHLLTETERQQWRDFVVR